MQPEASLGGRERRSLIPIVAQPGRAGAETCNKLAEALTVTPDVAQLR